MKTTNAVRAWMLVASGGKWTYEELKKQMATVPPKSVESAMREMVLAGHVTQYDDGRFGITHDCTMPRGLSVGEVLQVMGAA